MISFFAFSLFFNSTTPSYGTCFTFNYKHHRIQDSQAGLRYFGSASLLARVGVHGYSSACINAKRRLAGAIKGVVVIPFIPPPLGGCNDTEVIRSVIDTSIWLGSIPGYALSETSKGLVDMVMDDIAAEVGGGGLPTMTDQSSFRSHLRVMTVNMSPVQVGQAFRP